MTYERKVPYDLSYRIKCLRNHTQVEASVIVAEKIAPKWSLTATEFNRIIKGHTGNGDKTQTVLEIANKLVTKWEEEEAQA